MNRGFYSTLKHAIEKTRTAALLVLLCLALPLSSSPAQQGTGSVTGRVVDEQGNPIPGVQVYITELGRGTQTRSNGEYVLGGLPGGTFIVRARVIGYRAQAATVSLSPGSSAGQNFTISRDPLELSGVVVTGTLAPRPNLESSVAISTLSPKIIETANPRSTTEMLRLVPGFTRIESSGGEVNENISMRGILGVEYVMFMEDGLPVFPTMHTFFMNADNLFRADENIERMEVVRGGSSALFGSNTPGAIVNFINKTGGDVLSGTMKTTGASKGLARYDFNVNGPVGEGLKFNLGGFYRYDHGVRDPGFPGIRGGQVKASLTRQIGNGYVRLSAKMINDNNQFILDLPFQNPADPTPVPGFSDYGSMNTNEANHLRVPLPGGRELELPLDDGLGTKAQWYTLDVALDVGGGWRLENAAQTMSNRQSWNALLPFDVMTASDWIATQTLPNPGGYLAPGSVNQLFYTNVFTPSGAKAPYTTANGLVSPGGLWHVEKPLTHFQDQLTLSRAFASFAPIQLSGGLYFANYTQGNHWYFTDVLMDVADNPHLLDLRSTSGGVTTDVTRNGFRNFLSFYQNGTGTATIVSGVVGASSQLTRRFRTDLGFREEWNNFVQNSENNSTFDLDNNPNTRYNNETYGNGTFRHLSRSLSDWAASLGFNFLLTDHTSLYASGSRGYKMPALDEFLQAQPAQVPLFDPRQTQSIEGGVKWATPMYGLTLNGFYTKLKNIVSSGVVLDPATGNTIFVNQPSPENRSWGAEIEGALTPFQPLLLMTSWTFLKSTLGNGAGADIGSLILGVPKYVGNFTAGFNVGPLGLNADWHTVAKRFQSKGDPANPNPALRNATFLPAYNYFNFGGRVGVANGMTLALDILNAFQSQGLEEGNPRLSLLPGGRTSNLFLARPILPRRIQGSLRYDF
ncbi:MAG: TonB-dependent receptor domain-containing protein [Gemmatimonadaceae bacterium]